MGKELIGKTFYKILPSFILEYEIISYNEETKQFTIKLDDGKMAYMTENYHKKKTYKRYSTAVNKLEDEVKRQKKYEINRHKRIIEELDNCLKKAYLKEIFK